MREQVMEECLRRMDDMERFSHTAPYGNDYRQIVRILYYATFEMA